MNEPPILSDPPSSPPVQRNGCMTALAIVAGVVLLLPGICAILLINDDPKIFADKADQPLVLLVLAIGAGGVALIWWAVRRAWR